jgi:hypothetical protein
MMTTTMKSMLAAVGAGIVTLTAGCAREMPNAPSEVGIVAPAATESASTAPSTPTVTLLPDLTVDQPYVTVSQYSTVKMVNKSGRYAKVHSYNCSEFSGVNLPNGGWIYTWEFSPAGKTCDYFVWDVNRSRKLFQGKVSVQ